MNGTNYEVPHCGAFSTPNSHPSWAEIFASGSCFQMPLASIPPLLQFITECTLYLIRLFIYVSYFNHMSSWFLLYIMNGKLAWRFSLWSKMIKNILKWREESDTYLTHVCRHRRSRQISMKVNELGSFQPKLWLSSAVGVLQMSVSSFHFKIFVKWKVL